MPSPWEAEACHQRRCLSEDVITKDGFLLGLSDSSAHPAVFSGW